jgi:hypothetical protein
MRRVLVFALAALAGGAQQALEAQTGEGAVTGSVVSAEGRAPLPGATLSLRTVEDSTEVRSGLTDARGGFRIGLVDPGAYHLVVTYLGYGERWTEAFDVHPGLVRDVGTLELTFEAIELEPISVTAERSAVSFEPDRTSYLLDAMVMAEGGAVVDALRGLPEVEVDIDGNVRLRDASPAIYVDGRPAPMSGQSLTLFLEQFPADHIERIEIIDNPSARFGAEGSGGIINIVLKEGVELGLSGSVFLNGGTRGQWGSGARGTMQKDRWTFTGGLSTRWSENERSGWDLRENLLSDPTTFLRQDTWSSGSGLSGSVDLQARFQATERARVWARTNLGRAGSDREGLTTTTHMDALQDPTLRYDRSVLSDGRNRSVSLRSGFEFVWEPRRHSFEIEVEHDRGRDRERAREEIAEAAFEPDLDEELILPAELTLEREQEVEHETGIDVVYQRPLGENGRLQTGWSLSTERSDSDHRLELFEGGAGASIEDRGVVLREVTHAGFAQAGRSFGGLGFQAGLRAEEVRLDFEVPSGEVVERRYFDLFPSLSLSYSRDRSKRVRLSYSRRIGRPSVGVLDPTNRSTDPLNRTVGNPDLEPRYTHSVSLNASWSGSLGTLSLGPYWRRAVNGWERIIEVDEQGVSTRTWDNLASQTSYGASATLSLRRRGGWGGRVSVTGAQSTRDASNLADRFSGSSFRWSARSSIDGTVWGGLRTQGSFTYSPAVDLPQGRTLARRTADFSLRYRFLDERASLGVNLRDPFLLRRDRTEIRDQTVVLSGSARESTRSLQATLSYALGGRGRRTR